MKLYGLIVTCILFQAFQFNLCAQTSFAVIDGYVQTKNGGAINGAQVYLSGNIEFLNSQTFLTNQDGYYQFDSLLIGDKYFLKVYKNDDPKNGISVIDMIRIQKHLLGIDPFTAFDQFIAADANNSHFVSAIDLIEIRKLILGIYTGWPNNTSWRFGTDLSAFQAIKVIESLDVPHLEVNFIGIKIGDLMGN